LNLSRAPSGVREFQFHPRFLSFGPFKFPVLELYFIFRKILLSRTRSFSLGDRCFFKVLSSPPFPPSLGRVLFPLTAAPDPSPLTVSRSRPFLESAFSMTISCSIRRRAGGSLVFLLGSDPFKYFSFCRHSKGGRDLPYLPSRKLELSLAIGDALSDSFRFLASSSGRLSLPP